VRTFSKRDGSVGKVTNVTIGDETGRVRVTLWDDIAENMADFVSGDVLDIKNGYTRERYGRLEVHVGNRGLLQKGTGHIEFVEKIIPIRTSRWKSHVPSQESSKKWRSPRIPREITAAQEKSET